MLHINKINIKLYKYLYIYTFPNIRIRIYANTHLQLAKKKDYMM